MVGTNYDSITGMLMEIEFSWYSSLTGFGSLSAL